MKKILVFLMMFFACLLLSCMQQENYGKKVIVELEIEQDAPGVIMITPEGVSFSSRDSTSDGEFKADQVFDIKDLLELPLNTKKAIVEGMAEAGMTVPQKLVDAITAEEEQAAPSPDISDINCGLYKDRLVIMRNPEDIGISGNFYPRFVFPKDGPEYGQSFKLVWSDSNDLLVPDSVQEPHGYLIGKDGRKYVAGKPYFNGADAHQTMEAYAPLGSDPQFVVLCYNEPKG